MRKLFKVLSSFFAVALLGLAINVSTMGCAHQNWQTANTDSVGIAPLAKDEPKAVVQLYAARTYGWRGYFAVHSWLAYKEKNATEFTVNEVIGWRARRGLSVVAVKQDLPDRRWYGHDPALLMDLRGEPAEKAIPKIKEAIASYPYPHSYRAYPGPNSNTFVAHIIRNVPELETELPPTAIGKDWIDNGDLVGRSESGTGVQFSVFGMLGATVGLAEGVEINLLGMSFGVDVARPALKIPFLGRVGFSDGQLFTKSE